MGNIKKYILLFIFLSFALTTKVSAAVNFSIDLPRDTTFQLDFEGYNGVSCVPDADTVTEVFYNNGNYYVKWKDGVEGNLNGSEYLTCNFDSSPHVPASSPADEKRIVLHVNYGTVATSYQRTVQLFKKYRETIDVFNFEGDNLLVDFKEIVQAVKITGGEYDSGKDYVTIDCPDGTKDRCVIKLKDTLPIDTSIRWAMVKIDYMTNRGVVNTVKLRIELLSNMMVLAYPGQYGTCNFGSEWSQGGSNYIQILESENVNLPACTAENSANPFITFYGWVSYNDKDLDVPDMKNIDVCRDYVVASSGSIKHDISKNVYFACYVSTGGIVLAPNGGEVAMQDNYIEKDGLIYIKHEGTVLLPEPTIPALYNEYGTGVFEGWAEMGGSDKIYKAGDSVPANGGRYIAMYSTGKTITGEDTTQKMVYVNETVPYKLNSTTVEGCSSTDTSKVNAYMSGGECMLTGVEDTGSEYVDVVVTTTGSTRTIKVRVVSREGNFGDDWNTVVMDPQNTDVGNTGEGYFENVSGADVCNTYLVSNSGNKSGVVAKYTQTGFGLSVTQYKAESRCDDNKTYLALCMDPGRPGPSSSDIYEIDTSFNPNNEFGRLVTHIVRKFIDEGENDNSITAANIALRIIEYYSIEELANSNSGGNSYLSNALAAYKALGNHLNSVCSDITQCEYDKIYNALGGAWTWSNDTVRQQVASFLSGFTDVEAGDTEIQNKATRKSTFVDGNDFLYQIEYTGEITFPVGMTVAPENIVADCGSVPGVSNCVVNGEFTSEQVYKYTFTYDIDLSHTGFYLPKTSDDVSPSIKIEAAEGITNANVFVIKTLNDNKQRMVIFNTEEVALHVSMPIYLVCDINKAPFKVGEAGFRSDLFKAAGCCQFITDETSNEFLTYCTADCVQTNFAMMCNPNYTVGDNANVDVYSIDEAYKAGSGGTKELNYSCIVDIAGGKTAVDNTNKLADAAGNFYALMSYSNNQYCTVSCKENWDISTSSFENFVGPNAIVAGQYFAISHDMFIGGARTCVTTYVDYDLYHDEVTDLSNKLTKAWSLQSEYSKVYSVLLASQGNADAIEEKYYYTYSIANEYDCDCDDNGENCQNKCYEWVKSEPKTCKVYKISTSTGDTGYQYANWNGQFATDANGNISTGSLSGGAGGGSEIHTDWKEGTQPSIYSSTVGDNDGYCKDEQNFEYLMDNVAYKGQNVKSYIEEQRAIVSDSRAKIKDKSIDMTNCQNFMLKNNSTKDKNSFNVDNNPVTEKTYTGRASISGFVDTSSMPQISTKFEPSGSYTYEELEFMQVLGKDNVIDNHNELNETKIKEAGKDPSTFNDDCIEIADRKNAKGENIKLCKNKLTTLTYQSDDPWVVGSETAKTYGENITGNEIESVELKEFKITICEYEEGESYEYSSHGNCQWDEGIVVYYPINYIKQTLENSSYYKNKGVWVQNEATDVKIHTDTVEQGEVEFGVDPGFVSIFGARYNTFPIGLDTPKNIYQYTYAFADIGYFSDGKTGRIMGNPATALVAVNKHSCFYEVFEDLCICCGDPIMWTTYESSKLKDTDSYLDSEGYNFDYSGKNLSGDSHNFNGKMSYVNSSVSLYDLTGGTGRELADNWSSEDVFTYLTKMYKTDKGAVLANSIVSKGETIYDVEKASPEYSYTLNPSTIALVKEYNKGHVYGYSTRELVPYGISAKKTPVDNSVTNVDSKTKEQYITFGHFGSKFLETQMNSFVTDKFKDKVLTNRTAQGSNTVCSVPGGADAADQAYNLIQNGSCRWVDYVQTTSDGQELRLSFK